MLLKDLLMAKNQRNDNYLAQYLASLPIPTYLVDYSN